MWVEIASLTQARGAEYSHTKCGWKLHISHRQGGQSTHTQNVGGNCTSHTGKGAEYSHTKCGWKLHLSHRQGGQSTHTQNVGGNRKLYISCETTIASSCLILATNHLHVYTKSIAFSPSSTLVAVPKNREGRLGDFVMCGDVT